MPAPRLTPIQWLICAIAAIGFAFDTYVLLMACSPVGPAFCRSFWFLARNYAVDADAAPFLEFERLVQEQDRPVVETQRPEMLPYDLSAELHIRGVDKVSLDYRRWLVELSDELSDRS